MSNVAHPKANAEGLLAVGRIDRAMSVIFSGLAVTPNDPDLLFLLTRAQMMMGDGAAAVATAERLLAADPAQARSHWLYALALCEKWRLNPRKVRTLALPSAEEAVRLDPLSAEVHYFLAYCLVRSRAFLWASQSTIDRAREAALEALKRAPGWVPPLLLLAIIEKAAWNAAAAAGYAETALRLDPTDSEVLLSAIDHASFSRRRSLARRLAAIHPSHVATDLVLRTHRPIPVVAKFVGYLVIGFALGVADSLNFGELNPGPEYLWVVGPLAGFWVTVLGLGWRRRSLAGFDHEVRTVVFDWERRLRWVRRGVFWWLLVLPVLWIPSSLIGRVPSAWAVAWAFAGVVTVLLIRPRFGIEKSAA